VQIPSPLYVILDREVAGGRDLVWLLEAVLDGGCRLIQLRDKTMALAELYPIATRLRNRCGEAGALFIINDRLDLALAVDADGLHVGQDDLPAAAAKRVLTERKVLGVSTHGPRQAAQALADGADYIAVGSMFATASKAEFQLVGPELIRAVRPAVPVPLVGIGGITVDNVAAVIEAGADAAAVISAVCAAPDPAARTREFLDRIETARRRA
jgi:thiamine-phosphate pyrophosphorylase